MDTLHTPQTFVLIPAYNEAATIRELATRTLAIVGNVIVVDDGSTDATRAELAGLAVTVLANERNLGKASCLWRGIDHAIAHGAARVVTLDGDGQHDPADIPRLLQMAEQFPTRIVIGSRLHDRQNFPRRRYYANQFARAGLSWLAGQDFADTQSGFRVYPANLFTQVSHADVSWGGFVFESEILIAAAERGVQTIAVDIPGIYPIAARRSHFRPVVDVARITVMALGRLFHKWLRRLASAGRPKQASQLTGTSYTPRKP